MYQYENTRKGQVLKHIWFLNDKQYREFIEAIEKNETDKVLDIIFDIYSRKGFDTVIYE